MQASAKPEFSVNIVTNLTTPASRETASALPMRMTVSKVNFFYGQKQILFDINMGIADKKVTAASETLGPKDTIYASVDTAGSGHIKLKAVFSFVKGDKTKEVDAPGQVSVVLDRPLATLHVTSMPPGGEVAIDGKSRGKAPLDVGLPGFQRYEVEVTLVQ